MEKRIAIIGAGISGLLACKHTVEKGFNPIVFEARTGIGGIWAQTFESTKLQTPKKYYQFSDFAWPSSVTETFPCHNQVMDYIQSYALHFNLIPRIKFNSRVIGIDFSTPSDEDLLSWDLWGGTGGPFSPTGKWIITIQDVQHPSSEPQLYEADFVILCIGKFSDLPNIPNFPTNQGPEAFDGQVMHSMDYAAMGDNGAAQFIKDKMITVVGFQKSALDLAAQVANTNEKFSPMGFSVDHPSQSHYHTHKIFLLSNYILLGAASSCIFLTLALRLIPSVCGFFLILLHVFTIAGAISGCTAASAGRSNKWYAAHMVATVLTAILQGSISVLIFTRTADFLGELKSYVMEKDGALILKLGGGLCVLIFCLEWVSLALAFVLRYYEFVEGNGGGGEKTSISRNGKVQDDDRDMKDWPWPFQV